ncbi:MAG: hypothetical protein AAFY60_15215, partial [Myxococcota bacterium]
LADAMLTQGRLSLARMVLRSGARRRLMMRGLWTSRLDGIEDSGDLTAYARALRELEREAGV